MEVGGWVADYIYRINGWEELLEIRVEGVECDRFGIVRKVDKIMY